MRGSIFSAAFAVALMVVPAQAQTPTQPRYSTATSRIGTLLADPAARAVIARRFPLLLQSKPVTSGMANRMTLRSLKRLKPAVFTDAALAAADADFAAMPGR